MGGAILNNRRAKLRHYEAAAEPDIPTGTEAMWWDTANLRMWLIRDRGGAQRKVELQ